jgi:hypothetical protein
MSFRWFDVVIALACGGAGCGGQASASPPPPAVGPAEVAIAPPKPGEWITWSHARKETYMRTTFLAEEQKIFAAWEPARYHALVCADCHGRGVDDGTFRMPSQDLPKLHGGPEGFQELAAKEPQVLAFMQKTVAAQTARLLGLPEFDMTRHTGFSCWDCHTRTDWR